MSAPVPNLGVNVTNSGDYRKCCPRRCSLISRCCNGRKAETPDSEAVSKKVSEAVAEALSSYDAVHSTASHSPRGHVEPVVKKSSESKV